MYQPDECLIVEQDFTGDVIDDHTHQFCASALSNLSISLKANGYDENEASIVILLLEDLLKLTKKFLNGHIPLNESGQKPIEIKCPRGFNRLPSGFLVS